MKPLVLGFNKTSNMSWALYVISIFLSIIQFNFKNWCLLISKTIEKRKSSMFSFERKDLKTGYCITSQYWLLFPFEYFWFSSNLMQIYLFNYFSKGKEFEKLEWIWQFIWFKALDSFLNYISLLICLNSLLASYLVDIWPFF